MVGLRSTVNIYDLSAPGTFNFYVEDTINCCIEHTLSTDRALVNY